MTPFHERAELLTPGSLEATLSFCAEQFVALCIEAQREHGAFFVALSGGSTPRPVYQRITSPPLCARIAWEQVHLFWSDERQVAPDDPESNFRMAMEAGFDRMPIPPAQIHRMPAEKALVPGARLYEQEIVETLRGRPFDLILLGLGEDGHIASLFPDSSALQASKRLILPNFIESKGAWRMTMTLPCLARTRQLMLYAFGPKKRAILRTLFEERGRELPAYQLGAAAEGRKPLWIADREARPAEGLC